MLQEVALLRDSARCLRRKVDGKGGSFIGDIQQLGGVLRGFERLSNSDRNRLTVPVHFVGVQVVDGCAARQACQIHRVRLGWRLHGGCVEVGKHSDHAGDGARHGSVDCDDPTPRDGGISQRRVRNTVVRELGRVLGLAGCLGRTVDPVHALADVARHAAPPVSRSWRKVATTVRRASSILK